MCEYVHVSSGAHEGLKHGVTLVLELQAVANHLLWEQGANSGPLEASVLDH